MVRTHKDAFGHKAGDHRYMVNEAYPSDTRLVLQVHDDSLFKLCCAVAV